ncbi:MAG: ATP:cob(I)alamin adenosyltransferase [Nakamurella sp.]
MATSRIYTKLGDDGSTGLLFGGRTSKASPLIETVGCIDETVAALGMARAAAAVDATRACNAENADPTTEADSIKCSRVGSSQPDNSLVADILAVQRDLFVVGADLVANPHGRDQLVPGVSLVTPDMVARLERRIDELMTAKPLRPVFVLPGANAVSAALDVARTLVRRAERRLVAYQANCSPDVPINDQVAVYVNRVSDLLYVLARQAAGDEEEPASHGGIG